MLGNIWKPMIQIHGKTILSMEFKSIIKTHDSNPWQFIHPKPNSHWQYQSSILIDNIKVQLPLAISKLNSYWQHQTPILIGNIKPQFSLALLYQKEKSPRLSNAWQRKKYIMLPQQKKDHDNHLMKKLIESYLEDYVLIL